MTIFSYGLYALLHKQAVAFVSPRRKSRCFKQPISKFHVQFPSTSVGYRIYISQWPVVNVEGNFSAQKLQIK